MALVNTAIKPFSADAFKDGEFITVTDEDAMLKFIQFQRIPILPTKLGMNHQTPLPRLNTP